MNVVSLQPQTRVAQSVQEGHLHFYNHHQIVLFRSDRGTLYVHDAHATELLKGTSYRCHTEDHLVFKMQKSKTCRRSDLRKSKKVFKT